MPRLMPMIWILSCTRGCDPCQVQAEVSKNQHGEKPNFALAHNPHKRRPFKSLQVEQTALLPEQLISIPRGGSSSYPYRIKSTAGNRPKEDFRITYKFPDEQEQEQAEKERQREKERKEKERLLKEKLDKEQQMQMERERQEKEKEREKEQAAAALKQAMQEAEEAAKLQKQDSSKPSKVDDFDFDLSQPPSVKRIREVQRAAAEAAAAQARAKLAASSQNNHPIKTPSPWAVPAVLSGVGVCVLAAVNNHQQQQQRQKAVKPSYTSRYFTNWIQAGGGDTNHQSASSTKGSSSSKPTKKKVVKHIKKQPNKRHDKGWLPFLQHTNKKQPPRRYTTPADHHPLALHSQHVLETRGMWHWLVSPEKLPWTCSALVALVYLLALASRVSCDTYHDKVHPLCWKPLREMTSSLQDGFCVWGANPTTGVCPSAQRNSHQYSFYVDTALAAVSLALGKKYHSASPGWTWGICLLILLHGLLHLGISNGVFCDGSWKHCLLQCPGAAAAAATPQSTHLWQWILYTLYNLGVVTLDVRMANFRLPLFLQYLLIVIVTAAFVALGSFVGAAWALPAVFVQSHALVSVTGIFANQDKITPLMGWCFLAATIVGLTEFLACAPILLPLAYGHVAYDAVLHVAVMASLIPRRNPPLEF